MEFKKGIIKECKKIIGIGIPITISQLLHMSMGVVDTLMTGNYSTEALAAVSGGSNLIVSFVVFGAALLSASQAIIAQMYGGGKEKTVLGNIVTQGIIMMTVYALFLIPLSRMAPAVLIHFGFEDGVIVLAQKYICAFAYGLPATLIFFVFSTFYAGISKPVITMYFGFLMLFVNIIGNYTLIYGHFGFPEMGAEGAGWTSTIAAWSGTFGVLIFTFLHREYRPFKIFSGLFKPDLAILKQIFKLGIPSGLSSVFEVSLFVVFALLMGNFGVRVLAASQIALNCASLVFMIPLSLSFALTTNVGIYVGQKRYYDARMAAYSGYLITFVFSLFSATCFIFFADYIAAIYTEDTELIVLTSSLLLYAGIFQLSDGTQVAGVGILRGYKDTKIPMFFNLISYWIIALPFGYILGFIFQLGAKGMWIGMIVGLTAAAIFHTFRFNTVSKKKYFAGRTK